MEIGKLLMMAGIAIAAIGALVFFAPGLVTWFGRLPGDIRIEGERSAVFVPITSTIVLSVAISILLNLLGRIK